MDLLLDTHTLLWWMWGSGRLGPLAHRTLADHANRRFLSAASVWEICIKASRGRLQLQDPPEEWIPKMADRGLTPLPITFDHAYAVRRLPLLHGDPFDRMLIAQAQCEGLTIVTVDPVIRAYDVPTLDASI